MLAGRVTQCLVLWGAAVMTLACCRWVQQVMLTFRLVWGGLHCPMQPVVPVNTNSCVRRLRWHRSLQEDTQVLFTCCQ